MYWNWRSGGLVLGAGWALSGFCPGTGVVAAGTGRFDALSFIAGGLAGAGLFMLNYESLKGTALFDKLFGGKVTLAETGAFESLIGANGALAAIVIAAALIGIAFLVSRLRSA